MGPLRPFDDPAFLSWANLRAVATVGLGAGVLQGLSRALWHGWGGVSVAWMVGTTVWSVAVLVGLHVMQRRRAR